jgi:flagellin-like hook-associated protein FlgL
MMAKTQTRLATGLKVNSALDNPTNFFTASALNGRAGDLSNLLDGLSSGIKTIEAADNGLKSITRTVESMQSTLRQARQDKSFKSQSFTIPEGTPTGSEQLTLAGGALGAGAAIDLATGGSGGGGQAVYSLAAADFSPVSFAPATLDFAASYGSLISTTTLAANDTLDITVEIDSVPSTFTIAAGDVQSVGNGDSAIDGGYELADILNGKFDAGNAPLRAVNTGTGLFIEHIQDPVINGTTIAVTETANQGVGGTVTTLGFAAGTANSAITGGAGFASLAFTLTIDGGTPTFVSTFADDPLDVDDVISSIEELATVINDAYGSTIATINGSTGAMEIASPTTGSGSSVRISTVYNGAGAAGGLTNSLVQGTGSGVTGYKSVDALVSEINGDGALNTAVRASNDNGKLRIENLSTEDLTVAGALGTGEISGNDVRRNLVEQFNGLRDQLDKFADDASFNGINLLRGDKLKLTFNEIGTSTIEIQAEDTAGQARSISSLALGLDEALNADFDSDATLDALLETMKGTLETLRSQSSSFGSKLAVVENRNDFTRSMINTLETGAADLSLADTNQEAANLLALQTRQQLSSTALSMASQADQAVLRLF